MNRYCYFFLFLCIAITCYSQTLRFSNHRPIQMPEDVTFAIGPFYSSILFKQIAGYRYTWTEGTGTDFLFDYHRGNILKDGGDFPLISSLLFRNYVIITKYSDLDISFRIVYAQYPLDTQEDEFFVEMAEEGVAGNLSWEYMPTPFMRIGITDILRYRTDYVNSRGIIDEFGGEAYKYFRNEVSFNKDWLFLQNANMSLSLSRLDNVPRDDKFGNQHYTAYRGGLAIEYKPDPRMVKGIEAMIRSTDYSDEDRNDIDIAAISLYASAGISEFINIKGSLGYCYGWRSEDIENGEEKSIVGDLNVNHRILDNVEHSLSLSRVLIPGYNTDFEIQDRLVYSVLYSGEDIPHSLLFNVENIVVDTGNINVSSYNVFKSILQYSYNLFAIVPWIKFSFNRLDNKDNNNSNSKDPELLCDYYNTFEGSVGVDVSIISSLSLKTSLGIVKRTSDLSQLEYLRGVAAAFLILSYRF